MVLLVLLISCGKDVSKIQMRCKKKLEVDRGGNFHYNYTSIISRRLHADQREIRVVISERSAIS